MLADQKPGAVVGMARDQLAQGGAGRVVGLRGAKDDFIVRPIKVKAAFERFKVEIVQPMNRAQKRDGNRALRAGCGAASVTRGNQPGREHMHSGQHGHTKGRHKAHAAPRCTGPLAAQGAHLSRPRCAPQHHPRI